MLMSRCLLDILVKMLHKQFDIEQMYEKIRTHRFLFYFYLPGGFVTVVKLLSFPFSKNCFSFSIRDKNFIKLQDHLST